MLETELIVNKILDEVDRQLDKWGEQNHPILDQSLLDRTPERMCEEYEIPTENRARQLVDINSDRKELTYMHILIEEIAEAASCGRDIEALEEELIQVAAVIISMLMSLKRNGR